MLSSENQIYQYRGNGHGQVKPERQTLGVGNAERILIVDANPKNSSFLAAALRDHYRVSVASRGTQGLKMALADDQPDLILLEAHMPHLDGFSVCEMLQSNIHTRHIPIMLLANAGNEMAAGRGMSLGAIDFICRPISSAQLLGKISGYLSMFGWMSQERRCANNN
jgi:PleD family two-component response regulator